MLANNIILKYFRLYISKRKRSFDKNNVLKNLGNRQNREQKIDGWYPRFVVVN